MAARAARRASVRSRSAHRRRKAGWLRLGLLVAGLAVIAAVALWFLSRPGGIPAPPPGSDLQTPSTSGLFAYDSSRDGDYAARAIAGNANVLYQKSPGGVLATAARVAALRPLIDTATAGSGIDPAIVEGIVFVESAGDPNAIAGGDVAGAAGLTQIVSQTGQSLLGMHIDLARSKQLTAAIDNAYADGNVGRAARLERQRERIDARFNPRLALAGTVRYLQFAQRQLGRADLAVESYHMGVGNLQDVLKDYDAGRPVPYVQLFFDSAPDRHRPAYELLSSFGDDSWMYYWRVLAAAQIVQRYQSDRAALERLTALQSATDSAAEVLHPPDSTPQFADPAALAAAYVSRQIVPLPTDPARLWLAYDPSIGSFARQVSAPAALYLGVRPVALAVLLQIGAAVHRLSGANAPLIVLSTVTDARYEATLGISSPETTTGYTFQIERSYVNEAQAGAFQAVLDRLQSLNAIAWAREPATIDITVASDAQRVLAGGV